MTPQEIKIECEELYSQIHNAEERLKELRMICKHEETKEGLYSYRVGAIQKSLFCLYCGELIKGQKFPDDMSDLINEKLEED